MYRPLNAIQARGNWTLCSLKDFLGAGAAWLMNDIENAALSFRDEKLEIAGLEYVARTFPWHLHLRIRGSVEPNSSTTT
jgi:hypothetical protein